MEREPRQEPQATEPEAYEEPETDSPGPNQDVISALRSHTTSDRNFAGAADVTVLQGVRAGWAQYSSERQTAVGCSED